MKVACTTVGVCLYCVIAFHFTISVYMLRTFHPIPLYLYVCWCHGLRLSDLNKKNYLLTYLHNAIKNSSDNFPSFSPDNHQTVSRAVCLFSNIKRPYQYAHRPDRCFQ